MKKNQLLMISSIVILIIVTIFSFLRVKADYENLSGDNKLPENLNEKLISENKKAAKDEKEYQRMLDLSDYSDEQVEKEEELPDNEDNTKEELSLRALSALLLDASNNRVLYEKDGYKKMAMASTTKIMTCIIALENSKPDEVVTVSSNAAKMPDVQLNIKAGEKYYLNDLLYSLMLESHNDTAVAIAEHVGGSVEGFAKLMNEKAKELGCEDTNFVTPNGLDANGHYTTARDLAVIASYAIKNDTFIKITNTSSHDFKEIAKGRTFRVSNKNRFLYLMEGAIGVKTGFTGDAGYCFVGAIKREDRTLISVVLGCGWPPNKSLKWNDTKKLMNYGIKNYREKQIFEAVTFDPVLVHNGQKKYETLRIDGNLKLLLRDDEKVKIVYEVPKVIEAPIKAASIIGYARYYINGQFYTKVPVYSTETIDRINYPYCFKRVLNLWKVR